MSADETLGIKVERLGICDRCGVFGEQRPHAIHSGCRNWRPREKPAPQSSLTGISECVPPDVIAMSGPWQGISRGEYPGKHQTKLEGLQRDCYEWLIRADTRTEDGATRTMGWGNAENLAPKLAEFVMATLRQKLSEAPERDVEMDALRFKVSQLTDRLARERNANGIRMSVAQVYEENPRGYRNLLQIQSVRHETEGLFIEVRGAALAPASALAAVRSEADSERGRERGGE